MSNRVSNSAVFALAVLFIVGGAWGIWRGSDYIQLERGWASVISGSVAATGGVLALAIGFVLRRLDGLHKALLAFGAGASQVATPLEGQVTPAPADPMPLGLASAPAAYKPEPQLATYADPALQAVAAVNMELLEREEHPPSREPHPSVSPAAEPASTEAPPEVIHAAHQGPADDMVKAAGVSDEPELDAAIEELLAEERGRGSLHSGRDHVLGALSPEITEETGPAPVAVMPEAAEKAPQGRGWRGLFSRRERRAAVLPVERVAAAPSSVDPPGEARPPERVPTEEETPAHADPIPRTGDDWFDRALSGLDEVDGPYQSSGPASEEAGQPAEFRGEAYSRLEVQPPSLHEPPGASAPAEPAVIGRYTSGNTTYIMFADGSIEAETPTGILRFASLAELKSYVEGGQ